jgi:hypothetical protein
VTHESSLAAVQLQSACVLTLTVVCPPAAPICEATAETWNRHAAGSCVTSSCRSLTVIDPRRVAGSAFSATRYDTVPSPCPSRDDVNAIQLDEVDAFQEHSRETVIVTLPVPPEALNDDVELETVA